MNQSGKPVILVIDTNFYLDELDVSRTLFRLAEDHGFKIAVPCRVRSEVLGLSLTGGKSSTIETMQNSANALEFLEVSAKDYTSAIFQVPEEVLLPGLRGDDDILDYCRWLISKKSAAVYLLTKDRQLNRRAPSMLIVPLREHCRALNAETLVRCIKTFDYCDWIKENRFSQGTVTESDAFVSYKGSDFVETSMETAADPLDLVKPKLNLRIKRERAHGRKLIRQLKNRYPRLASHLLVAVRARPKARKRRVLRNTPKQWYKPLGKRLPAGVQKGPGKLKIKIIDITRLRN